MSQVCNNCNIQNSNPSYSNSGTTTSSLNLIVPKKRYNPALSIPGVVTNINTTTQQVISKNINISSQSGSGGDSSSDKNHNGGSSTSSINQQTLIDVTKVQDVESNIVAKDDREKQKLRSQSGVYQQIESTLLGDKNTIKQSVVSGRQIKKNIEITKGDGETKKDKRSSRRRYAKTFGTLLISSPEFQEKIKTLTSIKNSSYRRDRIMLPDIFDGRVAWKDYISPVRNQGLCGSCWAFSSTFTLACRLAIYSKGKYNYVFSPSKLVFCNVTYNTSKEQRLKDKLRTNEIIDWFDVATDEDKQIQSFGCEGETLLNAWQFLYRYGVPEETCLLYGDSSEVYLDNDEVNLVLSDTINGTCMGQFGSNFDICKSTKKPAVFHRGGGYYMVPGTEEKDGSERDIREEIYLRGPCTTGMAIYDDFLKWNGKGIYEWDRKSPRLGGHAVVLIGWGIEESKPYWIVRNSWSDEWGENGYFRIGRGNNQCEIEENVIVGYPDIPLIKESIKYPILFGEDDYLFRYLWNVNDAGIKNTIVESSLIKSSLIDWSGLNYIYNLTSLPKSFTTYKAGENKEGFYLGHKSFIKVFLEAITISPNIWFILKVVIIVILFIIFVMLS